MNTRSLLWGMLLAGIVLGAAPGALWAAAPELPEAAEPEKGAKSE